MSHSLTKIWIHAIWSTKERMPLIIPAIEQRIHQFIAAELKEQGCFVKAINGMPDHIHCLFLLNPQKSIAEVIKYTKGSSSHFINQNEITAQRFSWQTGYAAYTVSESVMEQVYWYIIRQKEHHQQKTFQQEHEDFSRLHGFDTDNSGK